MDGRCVLCVYYAIHALLCLCRNAELERRERQNYLFDLFNVYHPSRMRLYEGDAIASNSSKIDGDGDGILKMRYKCNSPFSFTRFSRLSPSDLMHFASETPSETAKRLSDRFSSVANFDAFLDWRAEYVWD